MREEQNQEATAKLFIMKELEKEIVLNLYYCIKTKLHLPC